jgi:hypothetical protein
MQQPHESGTALILGAVVDFMHYLNELEAPIVVGKDYKLERLIHAARDWAQTRNVSLKTINRNQWIEACQKGFFRDKDT